MKKAELLSRQNPQGLRNCCFIFSHDEPFFRIYSEDRKTFTDYEIATELSVFIDFVYADDAELKEYRMPDGSIHRVIDFPQMAFNSEETLLKPGEIWQKSDATSVDPNNPNANLKQGDNHAGTRDLPK